MKKILSIILINIMSMYLFAGCVQETNNIKKNNQRIKIGVCISDFNDKFISYMINEMKSYSQSLNNVEVEYSDAKKDSNRQLLQVENFIQQGVDVIVVNPVDRDSTQPISDAAKKAGIPLISFNNEFNNDWDTICYVDSDLKQSGTLEMEYLAKKVNYKGNVAIIMGTMGHEAQRLRTEAFHEVIAKYPDMKIVAEQTAEWNKARGMALMENWLQSGKDIDVVACENDEMAIGALMALNCSEKKERTIVGGIDATLDALEYLKSGKLAVTVFPNGRDQSHAVLDNAVKVATGDRVEKKVTLSNELVTPEDADKYIAKWKS